MVILVAAYALSAEWNAELHDFETAQVKTSQDVDDLGNRTNAAVGVSAGAGAIGGVLLVTGLVEVRS